MPDWLRLFITSPLLEVELRLAALAALFLVARLLLRAISRQIAHRLERAIPDAERRVRLQTLLRVGRDVATILVLIAVIATALQLFGLDVGLVFASAGVLALFVSVSAQTIIRDYIGGILIIAEDHFRVGDKIEVGGKRGQVERVTLRLTYLRDEDGTLHLVSNGEMRVVSNLSRGKE
jgi:small conductance mechanosensitive channel